MLYIKSQRRISTLYLRTSKVNIVSLRSCHWKQQQQQQPQRWQSKYGPQLNRAKPNKKKRNANEKKCVIITKRKFGRCLCLQWDLIYFEAADALLWWFCTENQSIEKGKTVLNEKKVRIFVIWELFDDVCYCQATLWLSITCIARCQKKNFSLVSDVFTFWHKPSSSSSLLWFFFLLYRWCTSRVSYFMLGNIVCTHLPQIKIRHLRYRRCWILFRFVRRLSVRIWGKLCFQMMQRGWCWCCLSDISRPNDSYKST